MQQFKTFVSANQTEMKKERFAIKEIINSNSTLRGLFDIFLFEDVSAQGESPQKTYLKQVENSDIYIGIIGEVYGIKGKDGLSATEREFRHFLKKKSQGEVMLFIKGNDDKNKDEDVKKFIDDVKNSFIYKRFTNIDDLKVKVINSLLSYIDTRGAIQKGSFDQQICLGARYSDIDESAVKNFLENRAVKLNVTVPKISIQDALINILDIVKKQEKEIIPTNTAILFFGKDPSKFIPHHEIRIARFKGNDRISFIDSQEIKGSIYKMLDEVEVFFKRNTRLANKIVEFKRIDIPEYPYESIREAVINAIAHRDYSATGAPIIISIFDDRVEVSNPGKLMPGLNIKKLEGHHKARNKKICEIFHETKDMEKFGTGIKKMKRLMQEHGLKEPAFCEEGDFFVARFYGPGDEILELVPSIPNERQTDLKKFGLNERQIEALRIMTNEKQTFSNKEYQEYFKVSNQTSVRDMKTLMTTGFVKSDGKGRSIRYSAK